MSSGTYVNALTQYTFVIDGCGRVDDASISEDRVHADDRMRKDLRAAPDACGVRHERGAMPSNDWLEAAVLEVPLDEDAIATVGAADRDQASDASEVCLGGDPRCQGPWSVEKRYVRPGADDRLVIFKERDEHRTIRRKSFAKDSRLSRCAPKYDPLNHGDI